MRLLESQKENHLQSDAAELKKLTQFTKFKLIKKRKVLLAIDFTIIIFKEVKKSQGKVIVTGK